MATYDRFHLLRQALMVDAAVSGATGIALWLAARPLAGLFGLPQELLTGAGLFCAVYGLALVVLARRRSVARSAAVAVVVGNVLWVAASLWLLASGLVTPTLAGEGFVLFQAAAVLGLAALQWMAIARIGATITTA